MDNVQIKDFSTLREKNISIRNVPKKLKLFLIYV